MSLPQTRETAAAYRERDKLMQYMFLEGSTATEIAEKLSLSYSFVWSRLSEAGFDAGSNDPRNVWYLSEDDRRKAFTRRAAKGAAEALKGFEKFRTIGEVTQQIVSDLEARRG